MLIAKVPSYYNEQQLRAYLKKIDYSPSVSDDSPLPAPTLETLRKVVLQHLFTFPFEHVEMHYSPSYIVNVEPQALYNRFVDQDKGGSYCCGQNGVLLGMLRALDFPAYAVGCRANNNMFDATKPPQYSPLNHAALLVHPSDAPIQLADNGFGGNGLIGPIELKEGAMAKGCPPEQHRVVKGVPPGAAVSDQTGWIVEYCSTDKPWRPLFQFSEAEVYPNDYDALSFAFCARQAGAPAFWEDVMAMRPFVAEDGTIGRMTFTKGVVKRRLNDKLEVVEECKTEPERVALLKKYFGITITEEEMGFIQKRAALPFQ